MRIKYEQLTQRTTPPPYTLLPIPTPLYILAVLLYPKSLLTNASLVVASSLASSLVSSLACSLVSSLASSLVSSLVSSLASSLASSAAPPLCCFAICSCSFGSS